MGGGTDLCWVGWGWVGWSMTDSLKDSTFSTEELVEGETLLFDTFKKSPAGDWPLQMAVRKNPALNNVTLEQNVTYTATFYAGAGESNERQERSV